MAWRIYWRNSEHKFFCLYIIYGKLNGNCYTIEKRAEISCTLFYLY